MIKKYLLFVINQINFAFKKNYQINEEAFNYYKNFGRNDLNETIFKEIYKLRPGELLIKKKLKIIKKKFLNFSLEKKSNKKAEIKNKIIQKINSQLIADVPMALSLSGGIDSNVIYSVMREKYNKKFNIYFFYFNDYEKFNTDFNFAKQNAKHFNNNFIDIKITESNKYFIL